MVCSLPGSICGTIEFVAGEVLRKLFNVKLIYGLLEYEELSSNQV